MGYGRKIAFTGVGIVAAIFFVAWLANKTDILNKFVKGATNVGAAIGQGVGGGVGAVPIGFGQGISGFKSYEDWWNQFIKNPFGLGPLLPPPRTDEPPPPNPLLPPAYGDTGVKDRDSIVARAQEINRQIQRREIPGGGIELSIPTGTGGTLFRYKAAKRGLVSTTITTSTGGTRPVIASQALINRLKTNLAQAPRNISSR